MCGFLSAPLIDGQAPGMLGKLGSFSLCEIPCLLYHLQADTNWAGLDIMPRSAVLACSPDRGPDGASGLWEAAEVVACGEAGADVILAASGRRVRVPHASIAASRFAEGLDADSAELDREPSALRASDDADSSGSEGDEDEDEDDEEAGACGRASMALAAAAAAVVSVSVLPLIHACKPGLITAVSPAPMQHGHGR